MFFDINLLCPQYKGKFALVWIAATRGVNKLTKKQLLDVDVVEVCKNISAMYISQSQKPKDRLSLSLAVRLVNGAIKIFHFQAATLQEQLVFWAIIPIHRNPDVKVTIKKRKPRASVVRSEDIIPSQAMVTPTKAIEEPEFHPDHEITDQDLERALREAPQAHIDSITMREELPKRTATFHIDEEGFGELGAFVEMLAEHGPPTRDTDRIRIESRKTSEESPDEPQKSPERIQVVAIIEPPPKERVEFEETRGAPEQEVARRRTRSQLVREDMEAIQVVDEIEEPLSKRPRLEAVIQEAKQPEVPRRAQDVQAEPLRRRKQIVPKTRMHLVELNPNKKLNGKIKCRCGQEDVEIFEEAVYNCTKVRSDMFEDIYEQLTPILRRDGPFRAVLQRESLASQATGSVSGVEPRVSQKTPTNAVPADENATDIQKKSSDGQTPVTREKGAVLRKRVSSPDVQVPTVRIEPATVTETLVSQEIERRVLATIIEDAVGATEAEIAEMPSAGVPPQTIIEELPVAAFSQKKAPAIVTEPTTLPKKTTKEVVEARQRKIVRIVKEWDYSTRDLTIDDVSRKPVNRLNIAVAFSDLLNLHKLQYVVLKTKQGSMALEKIEKGPKL